MSDLEAENARLRAALQAINDHCTRARGEQSHRDTVRFVLRAAHAALKPQRAIKAPPPPGWPTLENVR